MLAKYNHANKPKAVNPYFSVKSFGMKMSFLQTSFSIASGFSFVQNRSFGWVKQEHLSKYTSQKKDLDNLHKEREALFKKLYVIEESNRMFKNIAYSHKFFKDSLQELANNMIEARINSADPEDIFNEMLSLSYILSLISVKLDLNVINKEIAENNAMRKNGIYNIAEKLVPYASRLDSQVILWKEELKEIKSDCKKNSKALSLQIPDSIDKIISHIEKLEKASKSFSSYVRDAVEYSENSEKFKELNDKIKFFNWGMHR